MPSGLSRAKHLLLGCIFLNNAMGSSHLVSVARLLSTLCNSDLFLTVTFRANEINACGQPDMPITEV